MLALTLPAIELYRRGHTPPSVFFLILSDKDLVRQLLALDKNSLTKFYHA